MYLLFYLAPPFSGWRPLFSFGPLVLSDVKHEPCVDPIPKVSGFIIDLLNTKNLRFVWLLRYTFCVSELVVCLQASFCANRKYYIYIYMEFNMFLIETSAFWKIANSDLRCVFLLSVELSQLSLLNMLLSCKPRYV
jgi:hypothetical protein